MRDVALMAYVRPRVNVAERKSLTQGQGCTGQSNHRGSRAGFLSSSWPGGCGTACTGRGDSRGVAA